MFSKKSNKVVPIGIPPPQANEMIGSNLTTPTSPGIIPILVPNGNAESHQAEDAMENSLKLFHNIPGVAILQEKPLKSNVVKNIRSSLVYFYNQNEEKEKLPKFKCKMRSYSCWKFLCSHCQGFDIEILHVQENQPETPFLRLVRPCSISLCGYWRPRTEVYHIEHGKSNLLGYFLEPSYCFDIVLSIYGEKSRAPDFLIDGNCLQRNIWCPGGTSNQASFSVATNRFEVLSKFVRTLKKENDKYTTDESNGTMVFPLDSSDTDIALLTCAAVLLDFKYFNS